MVEIHTEGGLTLQRSTLTVHEPSNSLYPDVFVGKLRPEDRQALAEGKPVTAIQLGAGKHDNRIEVKLMEADGEDWRARQMKEAKDVFILIWTGNKVPRGVDINGHKIAWTQNGEVVSDESNIIGVYDRLLEWGGPSGHDQQMLVFCTAEPKVT